jgi:hypothetical protein
MQFGELVEEVSRQWSGKMLDVLRYEAAGEDSGIAFDAVREQGGKRIIMVVCVADQTQVELAERYFSLTNNGEPADWAKLSLAEFLMRAGKAGGLAYEDYHDASGKRMAIAFAAVGDSVAHLQGFFQFPP